MSSNDPSHTGVWSRTSHSVILETKPMVPILSTRTLMLRTGLFQMIRLSSYLNRHLWTLYRVKHDCTEAETIQPSALTCSHAPLWPLTCLLCLHPVCGTVSIRRSNDLKNLCRSLQKSTVYSLQRAEHSLLQALLTYVFSEFQTSLSKNSLNTVAKQS